MFCVQASTNPMLKVLDKPKIYKKEVQFAINHYYFTAYEKDQSGLYIDACRKYYISDVAD